MRRASLTTAVAVIIWAALIVVTKASEAATYSLWSASTVPTMTDSGPDSAVELGIKFKSDTAGTITAIRFYKAKNNTGTHVGNVWNASGTRLATATFSGETASGWQQVNLSTAVSIAANTYYVVSYHTNSGHYSDDIGYFSGKGVDAAPLHAPADGVSGYNGVYAYGSSSKFPNQGWQSSNYWVDLVFTPATADTTAPTVTAFSVPTTSSSLTVPISTFTATDNLAVTGYLVTESATAPSATATGWSAAAPASYTFSTAGTKTLYAWAKDAAGNVSTSRSASVTVTIADTTAPTITAFSVPSTATTLTVAVTTFTATDNVAVTGYLVTESATKPSATATGWSSAAPGSYTFTTTGSKTLYAWAKDAAGNVSASRSATVTVTADTTAPNVTAFTIPSTSTSLTVAITAFTATDNVAVTGYLVTESSTKPSATASGWSSSAPGSYAFTSAGSKTLYAWAKDAAGNVSTSRSDTVTITIASTVPEPSGWLAGDPHVHRSCGGSPESVSSLYLGMGAQNLAFISLLADMGNGEVQNPVTDLPLVNGQDDPVSTPGRTVHWDAEWHWDATYTQYPHQALGGHILALGLSDAYQIWQEYTYPIIAWAHQQGGIAGYAHLQNLDGSIPQTLNCCGPIEYPVEVALGTADFIEEDVVNINYPLPDRYPEAAIQAYYRLLNCGFRPGFAAGTDHPCDQPGADLGSLLTYVQTGQNTDYRSWINGIAQGRTVISRNGHNEFLDLKVNSTATPGDEIALPSAGTVPVTVTWSAITGLSGTIELVQNGVVVASKDASVAKGTAATLTASVDFTQSGWLAARRMSSAGHVLHTGAVFVIVGGAPIRVSADDANYYVQWMDNLLQKTSPGGAWAGYFVNDLAAAQARYQAAKAVFQQIAAEAGSGGGGSQQNQTIFTSQVPTLYENDDTYELGTRFFTDTPGQITQVRIYTNGIEGGTHTVRIWRRSDATVVAGPFTWDVTAGTAGWTSFTLPTRVSIAANTDYIVAVSNSSDHYYAEQTNGFAAAIVNGNLHTYVGSGLYATTSGAMPSASWQNTNYFRDIIFVPNN
ncbi:DUF4082 domain-containing protein [Geomesophilobacter sediminis]|uniref:DUF4082 domain-containing protein n=1 Tax=Geomesophilobacter sediminis TaxID=2798584 RepID=A0A8J7JB35_9BACT|nr:DUF4082 domain-containing protein [Geomesophilobacter sediminis]MBJ6723713.1 DUF4082 domain-containing protein [Geomesophilobacter sediminis]